MIAAASVAAALHGLDWTGKSGYGLAGLLDELTRITAIEQVCPPVDVITRHSRKPQVAVSTTRSSCKSICTRFIYASEASVAPQV